MATLTKKTKAAKAKVVPGQEYALVEAAGLLKEITFTKFDASVDIDIRLGIDPKKSRPDGKGRGRPSPRYRQTTEGMCDLHAG
jgi:large subunit ribosomal protein L1